MKTKSLFKTTLITGILLNSINTNAQIGTLKKALEKGKNKTEKENKTETNSNTKPSLLGSKKFDDKFVERYYLTYRELSSGYMDKGDYRLALSKTIHADSAKMCYEDILKNEKQYGNNGYGFKDEYEKFDSNAEFALFNNTESKKKLEFTYSSSTKFDSKELVSLNNIKKTFLAIKGIYSKQAKLEEMLQKLESKRNEYIQVLLANKEIMCAEQLDAYDKYYFSDKKSDECIKGQENIKINATENGVYIAIFTDHYQHIENSTDLFVNGKKIGSLSNLNYHKHPFEKGWMQILLLPGLKNIDDRSYHRLKAYVKEGLTNGATVELRHDYYGLKGSFVYDISSYGKDINAYLAEIKDRYLKTVQPKVTTYRNAAVEKEAATALEKFVTINPQYKVGTVVKTFVAGDYWETKKLYNGVPDYQYTNAYYYTKGNDGNCYVVRYTIRKDYDIKNGKYGAIKISGVPEETEVHCDHMK